MSFKWYNGSFAIDWHTNGIRFSIFTFHNFAGNICWTQPRIGLVLPIQETVAMLCKAHWLWWLWGLAQRSKNFRDHSEALFDSILDKDGGWPSAQWSCLELMVHHASLGNAYTRENTEKSVASKFVNVFIVILFNYILWHICGGVHITLLTTCFSFLKNSTLLIYILSMWTYHKSSSVFLGSDQYFVVISIQNLWPLAS